MSLRTFLHRNATFMASGFARRTCSQAIKPSRFRYPSSSIMGRRCFASSSEESARQQATIGPFTWKAAAMFLGTGTGLLWYFQSEKARVQEEREKEQNKPKAYGKPKLGGPFSLTNAETGGKLGTDDLNGRFYMIYFGFTHCPDICPEELDKMAEVVDAVKADKDMGEGVLIPVFITCDPRRDTPEIVKEYVKDFHDDLIGLTGNEEEIRRVAKLFRVYVSSPPNLEEGQEDYLVDHSIFFYLMSPDGTFLDCYSQNATSEDVTESFKNYYQEYKAKGGQLDKKPASLLQKKA